MKRMTPLIAALALTISAEAQTLNVSMGNVTYHFPAAQTGEMIYTDGTTLTVMGKEFTLSDVTSITIDDTNVTDNCVNIAYNGTSATIDVAGNVARYIAPEVNDAHVSITQLDEVSDDNIGEITYTLSGSTTDGEFYMTGSYKATVELNGLTLTNITPQYSGAAIHIQNGKRIDLKVIDGTTNTLTDVADGTQKACLYVKGHAEIKKSGTLNVAGNTKHAIKIGEYLTMKDATVNITTAVADGINCANDFVMESGTLTISGTGDDGIQCDLEGTTSTGEMPNHADEDSGNIYQTGGSINVTATATAAKCIKADGTFFMNGGSLTLNAGGDIDLTDTTDPSYTAGIKAADFVQNDGNIEVNVSGKAGRGIAVTDILTTNSGTLNVTNTGAISASTSSSGSNKYFCTARGLKATTVNINGGDLTIQTSGAASKGIKADGTLTIAGGTLNVTTTGSGAYDYTESDAKGCAGLKSDLNTVICGGDITLKSTGTGGKGLKSDGTLVISDGTLSATSTGSSYSSGRSYARPKAIKADGALTMSGGNVTASSSSHEGIESKSTIELTGGTLNVSAYDDAINSASTMKLSGANITAVASNNDGIDSNGNMTISGGTIIACGGNTPECGLDVIERGTLNILGGTVLAIGGSNNAVNATTGSQCVLSTSGTTSANTSISVKSGNTTLASFTVPSNYSPSSSGGMGGMGGMGGNSRKNVLISCAGLTAGSKYTVNIGSTSNSITATTYTSESR